MRRGMNHDPRQAYYRRGECLLSLVVLAAIFAGCTSVVHKVHPEFSQRLESIKSVTVLPPQVAVYRASSKMFLAEKSETAHAQLADAIAEGFRLAERFMLRNVDLNQNPTAAEEFNTLRPDSFEWDGVPPCLPTPVLALREAMVADALLVTRALEITWADDPEANRIRSRLAVGLLLHPGTVVATPMLVVGTLVSKRVRQALFSGGLAAVQICLVNTRTGDELWSYLYELTGRDSLQDPVIVRSVVDEAFKSFQSGFAK